MADSRRLALYTDLAVELTCHCGGDLQHAQCKVICCQIDRKPENGDLNIA